MKDIIRVEELKFEYEAPEGEKAVVAIGGISFKIKKGQFAAVIGRNGSGKSTLAKNLNGLYLPSGGAVYIKDMDTKDPKKIWDIRESCGMVFQNPDNQMVSTIVEDDVAFGPENLGLPPETIRSRVYEALEAVDMLHCARKAPHLLSGGQKQRIAIAGVVAMRPECIVFDEPTAMLDPEGRKDIMAIIKKLNGLGITVILITHFMEEAARADRIIIMKDGKILSDATPEETFSDPEILKEANMKRPIAIEIAEGLRRKGFDLPDNILTEEDLVEFLCQSV